MELGHPEGLQFCSSKRLKRIYMIKAISIHNKKSQCCSLLCKSLSWEFDYRSCILDVAHMEMGTLFLESRQQTKILKCGSHIWKDRSFVVDTSNLNQSQCIKFILLFFSWIRSVYWNHRKIHKSQLTNSPDWRGNILYFLPYLNDITEQ